MPQAITVRQKRFAQAMALGKPATVAYRLAYPESKLSKRSLQAKSHQAKQSKVVQAELERLLAEPMLQPIVLAARV